LLNHFLNPFFFSCFSLVLFVYFNSMTFFNPLVFPFSQRHKFMPYFSHFYIFLLLYKFMQYFSCFSAIREKKHQGQSHIEKHGQKHG
jgi:hypothetical protein